MKIWVVKVQRRPQPGIPNMPLVAGVFTKLADAQQCERLFPARWGDSWISEMELDTMCPHLAEESLAFRIATASS